jgi:hypothetical protein
MSAPIEHPTHDVYLLTPSVLSLVLVLVERATGKSTTLYYQNKELSARINEPTSEPPSEVRDKIMECETILYIVDNNNRVYKQDITLKRASLTWADIDAIGTTHIDCDRLYLSVEVFDLILETYTKYRGRISDTVVHVGQKVDEQYSCFLGSTLKPKLHYGSVSTYVVDDVRIRLPTDMIDQLGPAKMEVWKLKHKPNDANMCKFTNIMRLYDSLLRGAMHAGCAITIDHILSRVASSLCLFPAIPRGYNDIDIIACD